MLFIAVLRFFQVLAPSIGASAKNVNRKSVQKRSVSPLFFCFKSPKSPVLLPRIRILNGILSLKIPRAPRAGGVQDARPSYTRIHEKQDNCLVFIAPTARWILMRRTDAQSAAVPIKISYFNAYFHGSAAALPWKYALKQWLNSIKAAQRSRFYGIARPPPRE